MRFSSCILPFLWRAKPARRRRRRLRGTDVLHVSSSKSLVSVVEKSGGNDGNVKIFLKGILKKPGSPGTVEAGKGRVKWMDYLGKELTEIKEFEPVSPPSPHLIEYESNSKHPHLRRFSPLLQQISSMPPYQVVALAPPVEPRTGSLFNEQGLSLGWNSPLEFMSSHSIHPSNGCLSGAVTPISPQVDPLGGTLVNSQYLPPMAPGSPMEDSLGAPFIKPQHPHLRAQCPSTDPLSFSSVGGIQLQCYQPLLQRISSAPSSNCTYLRRFHFLTRSKSTGMNSCTYVHR